MGDSAAMHVQQTTDGGSPAASHRWWLPVAACVVWLGLWHLTPGLLSDGVGSWFSDDLDVAVMIESAVAVVVVAVLLVTHRAHNRVLFARSRMVWVYALPVVLAVALPFHYGQEPPIAVYMVWMTVSVFWQNYLTFGLLQDYVRRHLPTWATVAVVAGVFWLGHAVVLPHRFGLTHPLASLAMVAMGVVFALLRARLGSLHLLLALHLSFYFALS